MFGNIKTKIYLKWIEFKGFKHGNNFNMEKGTNIDSSFCKLICCGDNVTLAKGVYILAHDASMKKFIGKTKVAPVNIGNDCFIGAHSVILPGVSIGNRCVIGANSCVTKVVPDGEVWGGVLAVYIMQTEDFIKKHKEFMTHPSSDKTYVD